MTREPSVLREIAERRATDVVAELGERTLQ